MNNIPMQQLRDVLATLQGTVGTEQSQHGTRHTVIMGATATLDMFALEHAKNDAMGLCRLMRQRYVENLVAIIRANLEELQRIATTGKSENLVQASQLLDRSFRDEQPKPEPQEESDNWLTS